MTTVLAWVAYSPTGERPELPRGVYVASDSRISWGSDSRRWDAGRKIFCSITEPHLFGYSGDVVFPSLVLAQIVSAIDQGILFDLNATHEEKNATILESMKVSHRRRQNVEELDFSVLHIHRLSDWPSTAFAAWLISYSVRENVWACDNLTIPTKTGLIAALGSGAGAARVHTRRWTGSAVGGTSRSIFSAFCDAISSEDNRFSGGTPQLASLYTEGAPRPLGFVDSGSMFLYGLEIKPVGTFSNIEWRDGLFQRIDPDTLRPVQGARRFARPRLR